MDYLSCLLSEIVRPVNISRLFTDSFSCTMTHSPSPSQRSEHCRYWFCCRIGLRQHVEQRARSMQRCWAQAHRSMKVQR